MTTTNTISPSEHQDKPLVGIALMVGFCCVIPFGDAAIKMMGTSVPLITLLMSRFVLQFLLLWPVIAIREKRLFPVTRISARNWWRLTIRTLMQGIGIGGVFLGLKYLPLADNTAICFIFPILMLLIGHFFLKEVVGAHRMAAAIVGFIGTLLVVQPNFAAVGVNALWPLLVAFTFVVFIIVTRQMTRDIEPMTIQALSSLIGIAFLLVFLLLMGNGDIGLDGDSNALVLRWPRGEEWWLVLMSGVIGTYGHLLMTMSLKYASSTTLAPMQYLEIPFATLIGWMLFADLPNQLATIGIVITVASGLYIVYREQRAHRAR